MAQALYRKWRPTSFDEVVGQEHVTQTLKNQIASGRVGHAYLFVGSRGCGKTTTARIFAREVNLAGLPPNDPATQRLAEAISEGRALDVIEIDAASHTSVDDIREIRDRVNFQPTELRYKVYIIDEVHMLSVAAFNALLKTLEEPPPHVIFILATTDPQKIPATVLSRCQRFHFRRVPAEKIAQRLRQLCEGEGIEADDAALRLIARHATGSLRDAVSLLDQLASSSSGAITAADVREALGVTEATTLSQLTEALSTRNLAAGLDALQRALDQGADPRQIARQWIEHLRTLLQLKLDPTSAAFSEGEHAELQAQAAQLDVEQLTAAVRAFGRALAEMRFADPQLMLELGWINSVAGATQPSPSPTAPIRSMPPSASHPQPAPATHPLPSPAPRAAKSAEPAPASSAAESSAQLTIERLRTDWARIISGINARNKPVAALLRSCHPEQVQGNTIYLRAEHDFARERMEKAENKELLRSYLSQAYGGKYDIRILASATPDEPEDAEQDPVLKAARRLGASARRKS